MAGIYIHIPFCKQACHYCDFHFSTQLGGQKEMVSALSKELVLQSDFGKKEQIDTIYFGGGTPSLLSPIEIQTLIKQIYDHYTVGKVVEITLEANPDDLSTYYINALAQESQVNRLSIGVQSFHDRDLQFMNRAHVARQSHMCLEDALKAGYKNITADLIFGSETTTTTMWQENLQIMKDFQLPHLSIYGLSIEENTALHHFVLKGKAQQIDDKKFAEQFTLTQNFLAYAEYEQYEVSNYAREGFRSKHNGNYWNQKDYLGIGPSAHSFYEGSRFWNPRNNVKYLKAINEGLVSHSKEQLNDKDRFNELLLTRLRCIEGISKSSISAMDKKFQFHFSAQVDAFIKSGEIIAGPNKFFISKAHRIFTDHITQELFYIGS